MAALEVAHSIFSKIHPSFKTIFLYAKPPPPSPQSLPIKLHSSISTHLISHNLPLFLNNKPTIRKPYSSTIQEATLQEEEEPNTEETQEANLKRKLYVFNLPWSLTVVDIKGLFGQCGTITDVEIIKQKNGRSRGYAFVTMATAEEAQAVVDKFDSHEVSGRIITVEFAKRFKRPPRPPPPGPHPGETRHKLYVSNLAWRARASHLREFFSAKFKPVSTRVIFNSPSGRSSGYGFVSFATRDEAEAAISALDGKELMGRALRLKLNEKNAEDAGSENEEENNSESQPEES
ncbi:RRM_1 domain-containing protein/RRM_6 domain-containing protein [Cephalotus follicularis]|uniref:RRM_1 domain-containing protein/RRM_6 domain-containing protein n=1 Tax=Cephalotus follicularis TaxID=3775 RepID=A0A1Q3CNN9_CEPFO|nr:RRM_1 domain-containing protein/RRM_6 domain-containing protein [Cephalotus follicularis]